jgi:hypothetical protein
MITTSIARLATVTVVTGLSTFALATPAFAQQPPEPGGLPDRGVVTEADSGIDWAPLGAGAVAGIALVGAGAAAAAGTRRHRAAAKPA